LICVRIGRRSLAQCWFSTDVPSQAFLGGAPYSSRKAFAPWPLRQHLECVPVCGLHYVEGMGDELEGDRLMEEVRHGACEDELRLLPSQRYR